MPGHRFQKMLRDERIDRRHAGDVDARLREVRDFIEKVSWSSYLQVGHAPQAEAVDAQGTSQRVAKHKEGGRK